jgi:hypothetical protein
MGAGEQIACASLVAAFFIALLVTANLFVEYRSSQSPLTPAAQYIRLLH